MPCRAKKLGSIGTIASEKAYGGRAIDHDVIVVAGDAGERLGQDVLPTDLSCERLGDRAQQNIGGSHMEIVVNAADDVTKGGGASARFLQEDVVHRLRRRYRIAEKSQRGMALWVHVDEQHTSLLAREKGR